MKKLVLFLVSIFFSSFVFSQRSNLVFFTKTGEKFVLFLNGIACNENASDTVKVNYVAFKRSYSIKLVFADTSLGYFSSKIRLYKGQSRQEITYMIETFNVKNVKMPETFLDKLFITRSQILTRRRVKRHGESMVYIHKISEYSVVNISYSNLLQSNVDTTYAASMPERRFSVSNNPFELISGFVAIQADYKFSKKISLEASGGHIFPIMYNMIAADEPVWSAYNGTIFRLGSKFYYSNNAYVGIQATYKDLYYSNKNFSNRCGPEIDYITFNRSERASLFGISAMFGIQRRIYRHMEIDYFFGLGLGFRSRNYTIHSINYCYSSSYKEDIMPGTFSHKEYLVVIPIGFKLRYTFYEKK